MTINHQMYVPPNLNKQRVNNIKMAEEPIISGPGDQNKNMYDNYMENRFGNGNPP